MKNLRDEQREWLRALATAKGWTLTEIAQRANLAQSTLTRFVNNEQVKHALSAKTIAAVERAVQTPFGYKPERRIMVSTFYESPKSMPSFAAEAAIYSGQYDADPFFKAIVEALPSELTLWMTHSSALDAVGIFKGDVLVVREAATSPAEAKDIVLVHYNQETRLAPTHAFRFYDPPFVSRLSHHLSTVGTDLVDNDRVRVVGSVLWVLRPGTKAILHKIKLDR